MSAARIALTDINALPREAFAAALGPIFEHSPWVAEHAFAARPFATVAAVHEAMMAALRGSPAGRQLAVIKAHPELGSKVARADITAESRSEQGSLGLDRLSDDEFARFQTLNTQYRDRFGFPFIVCVRRHTRDSILRVFAQRLANDPETERAAALTEIGYIARLRIADRLEGPGMPKTDGRLSTHVLDIAKGRPAAGVPVALYEVGGSARGLLAQAVTNADGRTDTPLLSGAPLRIGTYELEFDLGAHFAGQPALFGTVPLRFSIAEPEGHYHVPLLVTPWSYSTYRGS
ncbi:MAG: 2-oxo-4-hydroxy-4-carboxy-5-ureidoimidazoline decarboxylase [Pseudolabrys sp.]